jgi:superfamily II DNA/RNA helicase
VLPSTLTTRPDADEPTRSPSFADLGVPGWLVKGLNRRGVTAPFPIQAKTIPDALAGRDVCGRAPTGSGKTIAFGIPLVLRVSQAQPRRPRALVLAPTRELAAQICDELRQLGHDDLRVEAFYGGVGFGQQVAALRRGVDIAVACPGRLADLIQQNLVRLDDVEIVVIDEADRMADMGFLPEVRRLLDQCQSDRQTLLFSATLDGDVDILIRNYQQDPARHEHARAEDEIDTAEHLFWSVDRNERVQIVASIVARVGPTIVFCRTKHGSDRVAKQLVQRGVNAVAIHGGRSQGQRDRALDDFRRGAATAIVATDVAARGIHVDGVACVVHFDPPGEGKDYVHRSGRTGRAGADGVVISLVGRDLQKEVGKTQRTIGREARFVPADVASLTAGDPITVQPSTRKVAEPAGREFGNRPPGSRNRNRNRGRGQGSSNSSGDNRGDRSEGRTGKPTAHNGKPTAHNGTPAGRSSRSSGRSGRSGGGGGGRRG